MEKGVAGLRGDFKEDPKVSSLQCRGSFDKESSWENEPAKCVVKNLI